jgi:predicted ester cyclase
MSQTLTIDQRIEVPRRFMAEVFNGQDAERARDFFTADALWHGPSIAEVSGVDSIVGLLGAFIGALSDIRAEEQDVIATGDLVALRLVVTATQTGDMLGIPASGRDVRWDAVDIYRGHRRRQDQRAVGVRRHGGDRQPARRLLAPVGELTI